MASSEIDTSSLSADQQSMLEQYTAVTNQDLAAAIPLLQRCEWNVQIAIARFFDGEPTTDPVAEARAAAAAAAPPQDIRRQETLMNGFSTSSSSRSRRDPNLEPAPRIVPQSENQIAHSPNPILALIFAPFSLVYTILWKSYQLFGNIFPFLPRFLARISGTSQGASRRSAEGRVTLNPRDAAARFIREFEEEYGANELPFQESGYAQALDKAKRELKFLLLVLVSPEHDDTAPFVRETLLSPRVVNYIKDPANNILLWAGTVQDAESYQISTSMSVTKFPWAGVICHTPSVSSTAMSVVGRISGPMPPASFLSRLQQPIEKHAPELTRVRQQRQEQDSVRSLREQQDSAYERSLAQDRERAKQKKEEAERKQREEDEARRAEMEKENLARNLERWRKWRVSAIAPEPSADVKDVVRISLRMPDGERLVRKFAEDAKIEELYAFVECYDILQSGVLDEKVEEPNGFKHEYGFRLVSPMPREAFEVEAGGSLKERIGRSGNLIVEKISVEEDSDEEEE
ncbi:UBX domain-containing protein [Tothia fuscella]|uniref:UBX domain-containing protein n=1 Tax=Tothia fuscella TaxID=1048955 RepID=A0A9P4NET2_9PEZI|nr:UBX domain-containing protein [Tothia fuscella]